jgi:hypothetical protein
MSVFDRIKRDIRSGMVLYTPVERSRFTVDTVDTEKVVFRVGKTEARIAVPKACWDGIPNFLRGKDWVRIGARHEKAQRGTFEEYLDTHQKPHQHSHPSWASYVVPVLEHLKIVEVGHHRPSKVRLNLNQP